MLAARRLIPRRGPAARGGPAAPLPRRAPASPQRPARARGVPRGPGPATAAVSKPRGPPAAALRAPVSSPPSPRSPGSRHPGRGRISQPAGSSRVSAPVGGAGVGLPVASEQRPAPRRRHRRRCLFSSAAGGERGREGGKEVPGCPRRHFPHGAAAISPAHPRRTGPAGGVTGAGIRGAEPAVPPAGSLLAAANLPRRTRRLRRGDGNGVGEGGTGTDRLAKRPQAGKGPPRRCRGTGQTHTHTHGYRRVVSLPFRV